MNSYVFKPDPTAYYRADEVDALMELKSNKAAENNLLEKIYFALEVSGVPSSEPIDDKHSRYLSAPVRIRKLAALSESRRIEITKLNTRLDDLLATSDVIAGQRDALRVIAQLYRIQHRADEQCVEDLAADWRCAMCEQVDQLLESLKPKTEGV